MFMTLLLLFINTGPLNAAMANVLPPDMRGRGFALNTMAIHVLGDAPSPLLIGVARIASGCARRCWSTGLLRGRRRSGAAGGARRAAPRPARRPRCRRERRFARELEVAAAIAREASVLVRGYHGTQLHGADQGAATSR